MPLLIKKNITPKTKIAVWENTEDDGFFITELGLTDPELLLLDEYNAKRKSEILSSRHLLRYMCNKIYPFKKDKYGKPYLEGSQRYISLSHSGRLTAAIISDVLVGIDIQKRVEKITRIQHKYVSELEQSMVVPPCQVEYLHVLWGAKESLYKAYGKKEIDFIKHLKITPFRYNKNQTNTTKGEVIKNKYHESFKISAEEIENYFLVCAYINDN